MPMVNAILAEIEQESRTTRKVLERVPEDQLSWKPHEKSFSMGQLASHVANLIAWTVDTMTRTEFDLGAVTPEEMNRAANNGAELLRWFDANAAKARASLDASDADYQVPWTLRNGAQVFFTLPRYTCIRSFCLNHIVHHRAQLGVYLRLNDVAVPGVYGPSADEQTLNF